MFSVLLGDIFLVDIDGIVGCYHGFLGGMNITDYCVFYTSNFNSRKSNSSSPLPLH